VEDVLRQRAAGQGTYLPCVGEVTSMRPMEVSKC
jgi:hypothetical protein